MTERLMGAEASNYFFAQVVDVADPDEEGKIKIRPIHWTDKINIPDEDCPWAKPMIPMTNPAQNKMGSVPVGPVVGSWVYGQNLDGHGDQQNYTFFGTVAKAGDLVANGGTLNGHPELDHSTASGPIGARSSKTLPKGHDRNAFCTRKGKSIKDDDKPSDKSPPVQTDSDGVNITQEAKDKTTYGKNGTTGSIENPSGSILSQIQSVDPNNNNSVLPNALEAFQKLTDLNTFSSSVGINNILGQILGSVLNKIGLEPALQALGTALDLASMTSGSVGALQGALANINSTPSFSPTVQSVVDSIIKQLSNDITQLINSNNLNSESFNQLIEKYQALIKNNGATATIGVNTDNIMSKLGSVLPTISTAINAVQNIHLPNSVLDISKITDALKEFSMNQAFVKTPDQGKKDLAKIATNTVKTKAASNIQSLNCSQDAKNVLTDIIGHH